jgi:hypothetical protein
MVRLHLRRVMVPTCALLLVWGVQVAMCEECDYVETGESYSIVVLNAKIGMKQLGPGDRICVFDGDVCAGGAVCDGTFPMNIPAWKEDPGHGLPGYHPGNRITFLIWRSGGRKAGPVIALFRHGDGTFESENYATVILKGGVAQRMPPLEPGSGRSVRTAVIVR